ncbi:hypothetical protein SAMN04487969_104177 [Paenibacillus algorifonticola]|uniref:Uncharacterized protein n=1 Tax=Paenibacillus algorifonticola TaxID=684063 RepID=A0A1I2BZW8_9BACL|nr:hypothetical protein [Paenibacillus algorifonticola]SFE61574.1 hypothetical protein SAMN04487969_104177 [Paenibacillus algorifonticola]
MVYIVIFAVYDCSYFVFAYVLSVGFHLLVSVGVTVFRRVFIFRLPVFLDGVNGFLLVVGPFVDFIFLGVFLAVWLGEVLFMLLPYAPLAVICVVGVEVAIVSRLCIVVLVMLPHFISLMFIVFLHSEQVSFFFFALLWFSLS